MNIDEKISLLPLQKQKEFREQLRNILDHRTWFEIYGLDYVNPDVPKAKEILFKEKYESYLPPIKNQL